MNEKILDSLLKSTKGVFGRYSKYSVACYVLSQDLLSSNTRVPVKIDESYLKLRIRFEFGRDCRVTLRS